jgi:hypothetical protein
MNIKPSLNQLTLDFEGGLTTRHKSLRECCATSVYQKGLSNVAADLDQAPGNLSVQLSADVSRNFSVDSLEVYLDKYHDYSPIFYLVEKYLADKTLVKDSARLQAIETINNLPQLLKNAGLI